MASGTQTKTKTDTQIRYPDRYNVVLLNDDVTPMPFVVRLLIEVFNHSIAQATAITMQVHEQGKGVAGTYNLEIAEQKVLEVVVASKNNGFALRVVVEKI